MSPASYRTAPPRITRLASQHPFGNQVRGLGGRATATSPPLQTCSCCRAASPICTDATEGPPVAVSPRPRRRGRHARRPQPHLPPLGTPERGRYSRRKRDPPIHDRHGRPLALSAWQEPRPANLLAVQNKAFGVLKMTLHEGGYDYEWVGLPTDPVFRDRGVIRLQVTPAGRTRTTADHREHPGGPRF